MVTRSSMNKSSSSFVDKTIIQAFENIELINTDSIIGEGSVRPLIISGTPNGCRTMLGDLTDPFPRDVTNINQYMNPTLNKLNEIDNDSTIHIIPVLDKDSFLCSQVPYTLNRDLPPPHTEAHMELDFGEDGDELLEALAKKVGRPLGSKNKGPSTSKKSQSFL